MYCHQAGRAGMFCSTGRFGGARSRKGSGMRLPSPWELATPKRLGDPPPLQSSCRFLPPLVQSQGTQLVRARKLCVCLRDVVSTPTATSRDVKLTPKMNRSARCGTPLLFGPEPEPPLP